MVDCELKKKIGAIFEEIKVDVTLLYETFFSLLAQLTAFFPLDVLNVTDNRESLL